MITWQVSLSQRRIFKLNPLKNGVEEIEIGENKKGFLLEAFGFEIVTTTSNALKGV